MLSGGCASTALTAPAADVRVVRAAPGDECEELGAVFGSAATAAYSGPEVKLRSAQIDLRNNAAALGANFVVLDAAGIDSNDRVAYAGQALRCNDRAENESRVIVHQAEAGPANSLRGTEQVLAQVAAERGQVSLPKGQTAASEEDEGSPQGAGGFRLGDPRDELAELCVSRGFTWTMVSGYAECSGLPVAVGAEGVARLSFCEKKLCEIEITLPTDSALVARRLEDLSSRLESRYGQPRRRVNQLDKCGKVDDKCLKTSPEVHIEWSWPSGRGIHLELTHAGGHGQHQVRMTHLLNKRPDAAGLEPGLPAF